MTSRDRIHAAWNGKTNDHVPLTTWCFGLTAPKHLQWDNNGRTVERWYSKRMEHLHTLPESWDLNDDFNRVLAWHSMGVDDLLDVSVPWSISPNVTWTDSSVPAGRLDNCPVLIREYQTPSGSLRHAVRQTGEDTGDGWVVQPPCVPLIEDYNIPRAVEHAVSSPKNIPVIGHLFAPPDAAAATWFEDRMQRVRSFADKHGVPVQAWSAFGMDAAVWFCGTEGAVMLAMDEPEAFQSLLDIITETDLARTELAASTPGVDMVVERGWYSSTDFWSPRIFDEIMVPHISRLAAAAHRHGKKFGYVMTTGVKTLGSRLADAGVDVLYFLDPVQDGISVMEASQLFGDSMTLVGGTNSLSLFSRDRDRIREEVRTAIEELSGANRFILHPVDALFPDTPWESVEWLIEAWQDYR